MTLEQQIYDGNRAREVLENEAFQKVFADYKTEITEQWTKSPSRDSEGREKLWLMFSMLNRLEAMLKTTLETGEMRKLDLAHEEKKRLLDKSKGMDWQSLMAHIQGENKRTRVATVWHPTPRGEIVDCGTNNVRVLVGEHAYQLTTGEMVKV